MTSNFDDAAFDREKSSYVHDFDGAVPPENDVSKEDKSTNTPIDHHAQVNGTDFDQTRRDVLQRMTDFPDYPALQRDISQANGRILAEPVIASSAQPRIDQSSKTGFAVRSEEFFGAGPWKFSIIKPKSTQRHTAEGAYSPRSALEVTSGQALPAPYDCVVQSKDLTRSGDHITIETRSVKGKNIHQTGVYFSEGTHLLSANQILQPRDIACLAENGNSAVAVRRKLRIALISIGNGLADAADLKPGDSHDRNRPMLTACLAQPWITLQDHGIIMDDVDALRLRIRLSIASTDVLITTGGQSEGNDDHLREVIEDLGGTIWTNDIVRHSDKLGLIGSIGDTVILGLPSDPTAVFMAMQVLGLDVLRARVGLQARLPQQMIGVANFDMIRPTEHTEFALVEQSGTDENGAAILDLVENNEAASIWGLSKSDGFMRVDPDCESIQIGEKLNWTPFPCAYT